MLSCVCESAEVRSNTALELSFENMTIQSVAVVAYPHFAQVFVLFEEQFGFG